MAKPIPDAPPAAEGRRERGGPSIPAIVKKYANRRLYNTASSSYVTLDELSQMIRRGEEFVVFDAKSGDDITRSVLTQIILEEDAKGRNLLPIGFLRQLIGFYDHQMQSFVPRYLEVSLESFTRHQDQLRGYMENTVGRFFPLAQFEDMARQNLALFQRAATMFQPVPPSEPAPGEPPPTGVAPETQPGSTAKVREPNLDQEVRELRAQMESLQRQLAAVTREARNPAGGD